jgi:hypothetical protein
MLWPQCEPSTPSRIVTIRVKSTILAASTLPAYDESCTYVSKRVDDHVGVELLAPV